MDAQQCRCQAEHYSACASQVSDPNDKVALRTIVAYWVRMAEQAQRYENGQTEEK
jgi:hypothetical protein